jgi:hypothetical protein
VWYEFIDFSCLFVVMLSLCKSEIYCLWLCCNHQDLLRIALFSLLYSCHKKCVWCVQRVPRFGCLYSYHRAFEMERIFIRLEHVQCWLFVLWFLEFHFLRCMFMIQWWRDPSDPRNFHYSCGWWKNTLFKYVHTSIKVLINLKYYLFVSCSFFAFMQVYHIL